MQTYTHCQRDETFTHWILVRQKLRWTEASLESSTEVTNCVTPKKKSKSSDLVHLEGKIQELFCLIWNLWRSKLQLTAAQAAWNKKRRRRGFFLILQFNFKVYNFMVYAAFKKNKEFNLPFHCPLSVQRAEGWKKIYNHLIFHAAPACEFITTRFVLFLPVEG